MKSKYLLFLVIVFILNLNVKAQESYSLKPISQDNERFQKRNDSIFPLKMPPMERAKSAAHQLPYPIIFIHGLNSSSATWDTATDYYDGQYGLTFGGRLDYCLNSDYDNVATNLNLYSIPNADITAFANTLVVGDYYYLNFNVSPTGIFDPSGSENVQSNQAAVAKQGKVLQSVIQRVMTLTGKDKVLLVGHSMGGLASREYIQNSINWQTDGKHHVAKLLTIGTPNGGSNASDSFIAFFIGTDKKTEAIRDLKTSYYYSEDAGRYLFGGIEINNSNNMNDSINNPDFYNVDVNCNGVVGENIVGLNQKPIDNLIDFTSVIGKSNNGNTDGVVTNYSAILNNFYPSLTFPPKNFYYSASTITEVHTSLTPQYYQMLQGLDEPKETQLAYRINLNTPYIGFSTVQQNTSDSDVDMFSFTVPNNVMLDFEVSNIAISQMKLQILDVAGLQTGNTINNAGNILNHNMSLPAGNYFLKLTGVSPNANSYKTPYYFSINSTLSATEGVATQMSFYPNPTKDFVNFKNSDFTKAVILSGEGRVLETVQLRTKNEVVKINLQSYPKGIYLIQLSNDASSKVFKIIKD